MLDSDSFSIICSFLRQPEILSFAFCNKEFFDFYYDKLHPEIQERFLRYGCKQYCEKYSVVTRFSKYLPFKGGLQNTELFLQSCVTGNHLLVQDILKKKLIQDEDFLKGLRWANNTKRAKVYGILISSRKLNISAVFNYFIYCSDLSFFDEVINYIVDIIPDDYDFSLLTKTFQGSSYKSQYVYHKILNHEKIAKRTKLRLLNVESFECLHCMVRLKQIEIILKKNNEFYGRLLYGDNYDQGPYVSIQSGFCLFNKHINLVSNIQNSLTFTDEFIDLLKENRKKISIVEIGILDEMKKDKRTDSCVLLDLIVEEIIKSNKKIIDNCQKMNCKDCSKNPDSSTNTHQNEIKNLIYDVDSIPIPRLSFLDEDIERIADYDTDHNNTDSSEKKIYDSPEDFKNFYQIFEYSEYKDIDLLSLKTSKESKGKKIKPCDLCNTYYEVAEKWNTILSVQLNKLGEKNLFTETYFWFKEYFQSELTRIEKNKIYSARINTKKCFCSMTSKELLSLDKPNYFHGTLTMLKKKMPIDKERWNIFLEQFHFNFSSIVNYANIPFSVEDKKILLKNYILNNTDYVSSSKIKKSYQVFLDEIKIDNSDSFIVKIIDDIRKRCEENEFILEKIKYLYQYFEYPLEQANDVTKALLKIPIKIFIRICGYDFLHYVLDKSIQFAEISKQNFDEDIFFKNVYARFYIRNKIGYPEYSDDLYDMKEYFSEKDKKDFDKMMYQYTIERALDIGTIEALSNIKIQSSFDYRNVLKACKYGPKYVSAFLNKIHDNHIKSKTIFRLKHDGVDKETIFAILSHKYSL